MAVVDDDGRLFGRVNFVDAALVVLVLLAMSVSIAAYRIFTVRAPVIASVVPGALSVDGDRRLRLEGQHFRPYLKAFFFPSGAPFSLPDPQAPDSGKNQATLRAETRERVELTLPPAPPGTYDLYLYDEGREVARKASAFTIVPRGETAPAGRLGPPPADLSAPIEIAVRFRIDPAIARLVKPGDTGVADASSPGRPPALVSLRAEAPPPDLHVQFGSSRLIVSPATGPDLLWEGVVRLAALRTNGVWRTTDVPRIRAGEPFLFETAMYGIKGTIVRLTVLPPRASQALR